MRKTWESAFALLAALALLLGLAACGGQGESEQPLAVGQQDAAGQPEELAEIHWYYFDVAGTEESAAERIEAAVNALTEREIGVHVNIHFLSIGDYATQLGMAVAGGDAVDLCVLNAIPASSFLTLRASNQLLDIGPYLAEGGVAAELGEKVGKYLGAYTFDGAVYGYPVDRLMSTSHWVVMRTDILEELALTEQAEAMNSWDDYAAILDAVGAAYDTLWPVCGRQTILYYAGMLWPDAAFENADAFDLLGDALEAVYTDQEGHVSALYAQPAYEADLAMVAQWYEKGYVYPDAAIEEQTPDELIKQGVAFSTIVPSELGVAVAKSNATGYEITAVEAAKCMLASYDTYKLGCGVPVTAEEPEAAMKFANLMATSSELMNLLAWGEEGTDYVEQDGEAVYPEGVEARTPGYYHSADYLVGNQFLVLPWQGSGADLRERAREAMDSAPVSAYLGFGIDTSELSNLISAITAVQTEYNASLRCGGYTPELYAEFLEKLSRAGIDSYIAEFQTQLDAWMAS